MAQLLAVEDHDFVTAHQPGDLALLQLADGSADRLDGEAKKHVLT
jgi:hypothetical protein